ncbi:MAG TPA: clostripain-related cysteine peptidase [Chthonomonadaceae bacterium]|nr:clostripain-related cysteine peptidase [Chthonomonadaceae bacterium]
MRLHRFVRRIALAAGAAGVIGAALSGCGGGNGNSNNNNNNGGNNGSNNGGAFTTPGTTPFVNTNNSSRAACAANTHASGRARWTVLVYMNAASNLQPFSLVNIAQMASVGSDADVNIVVQWKQTASSHFFSSVSVQSTPSFIGTRRYKLSKHSQADLNKIAPPGIDSNLNLVGDTTVLDGDRLPDPPTNTVNDNGTLTSDMGDYHTLADFVKWGETNFPADEVALVIWDHGSGALNVDNRAVSKDGRAMLLTRAAAPAKQVKRGLSQDTQTGSQIATQELPLAFANVPQKFDSLIIDCSLQGTTELAYDVRNSARTLVASEESPPGRGYPYDTWLKFLESNPTVDPCGSGQNLINDDIAVYPSETDITQSLTDLSKMDTVASTLNAFGGTLLKYTSTQASLIQNARQSAQFFEFIEFKDLYDFSDRIRTSSGAPSDLVTAAANMETSLYGSNGAVLAASHGAATDSSGFNEGRASGLSIFLPGPQTPSSVDSTVGFDPQWNQLGIAKVAPNWASFLQAQKQ